MRTRKRFLIGGLAVAAAFGFLLWMLFKQFGSFQLTVSQFMTAQADLGMSVSQFVQSQGKADGNAVAVHGWVGGASADPRGFTLTDGRQTVTVAYAGNAKPSGAEVVVEGKIINSVLQATRVTTTKEVRIEGPLSPDAPVKYDVTTRTTTFSITDAKDAVSKRTLPVVYTGAVPDTFFIDVKSVDVSLVVVGREGPNGVFHATQILTKCASKYEAAPSTKALAPAAR